MASPLLGIAAVNSLLFTAYGVTRRVISPYPDLSLGQIAVAGAGAGAINAVLASPVSLVPNDSSSVRGTVVTETDLSSPGRVIQNQNAGSGQWTSTMGDRSY